MGCTPTPCQLCASGNQERSFMTSPPVPYLFLCSILSWNANQLNFCILLANLNPTNSINKTSYCKSKQDHTRLLWLFFVLLQLLFVPLVLLCFLPFWQLLLACSCHLFTYPFMVTWIPSMFMVRSQCMKERPGIVFLYVLLLVVRSCYLFVPCLQILVLRSFLFVPRLQILVLR